MRPTVEFLNLPLGLVGAALLLLFAWTAEGASLERKFKRPEDELGQLCARLSYLTKISHVEKLITTLGRLLQERSYVGSTGHLVAANSSPFRLFSQHPMLPCLQQADAILDLAGLIAEKDNVCSSAHLNKIERYFERHMMIRSPRSRSLTLLTSIHSSCHTRRPITARFFELFVNQVSFTCKLNLLRSLRTVEAKQLATQGDYARSLPWLSSTNSELCKKAEQQEALAEEPPGARRQQVLEGEAPVYTKRQIQRCKAARMLSEISSINELVEAFGGECQAVGEALGERDDALSLRSLFAQEDEDMPHYEHIDGKSALYLMVPPDQIEQVQDMLVGCSKLEPIYEQTIMPIVRLARLGFNPTFANFDKLCSKHKLIQTWFSITLVCKSMLSLQLADTDKYKELKDEFKASKESLVIVDEEPEADGASRSQGSGFESHLNRASELSNFVKTPIEDELWIHKYDITKLQRLKNGMLKRMFKLLKIEDIDDHIIFRKRVAGVFDWIVKIVIIASATIALR